MVLHTLSLRVYCTHRMFSTLQSPISIPNLSSFFISFAELPLLYKAMHVIDNKKTIRVCDTCLHHLRYAQHIIVT